MKTANGVKPQFVDIETITDWTIRSSPSGDNCVEVGFVDSGDAAGGVVIRDTKDRDRASLFFSEAEFKSFTDGVKAGAFDR